jgi:hypothetical protein
MGFLGNGGILLERAIRRKQLNISELAVALNITFKTLYNWFKRKVIDEGIIERYRKLTHIYHGPTPHSPK